MQNVLKFATDFPYYLEFMLNIEFNSDQDEMSARNKILKFLI